MGMTLSGGCADTQHVAAYFGTPHVKLLVQVGILLDKESILPKDVHLSQDGNSLLITRNVFEKLELHDNVWRQEWLEFFDYSVEMNQPGWRPGNRDTVNRLKRLINGLPLEDQQDLPSDKENSRPAPEWIFTAVESGDPLDRDLPVYAIAHQGKIFAVNEWAPVGKACMKATLLDAQDGDIVAVRLRRRGSQKVEEVRIVMPLTDNVPDSLRCLTARGDVSREERLNAWTNRV